jgi:DNA modification methylase
MRVRCKYPLKDCLKISLRKYHGVFGRWVCHTPKAPFPYELPSRLIQLYTVEGETVLDPFGGSGTTMKVARNLKRNSFLYEINSEYIDLIKENVGWNSSLDSHTRYEIKIRKSITS